MKVRVYLYEEDDVCFYGTIQDIADFIGASKEAIWSASKRKYKRYSVTFVGNIDIDIDLYMKELKSV